MGLEGAFVGRFDEEGRATLKLFRYLDELRVFKGRWNENAFSIARESTQRMRVGECVSSAKLKGMRALENLRLG